MADSLRESIPGRLEDLIHAACDGVLGDPGYRELERLLNKNDAAKKRYIELIHVSAGLMDWAEVTNSFAENARDEESRIEAVVHRSPWPAGQLPWRSGHSFGLALAAAAMLSAVFFLGAFWGGKGGAEQARRNPSPKAPVSNEAAPEGTTQQPHFVARVTDVSPNVTWGKARPREFLLRMTSGEKIDLLTGTAQIEFASGAKVILQGPTSFEPLAADTARLLSGRITGHADNGNFRLLTPSAEVIDLGTEFGVSIDGASNTDVCVFDGEVDVTSTAVRSEGPASTVRLTEGMAVRVAPNGNVDEVVDISRIDFRREVPGITPHDPQRRQISLVDIIAGGSGRGARLAGAINPVTGDWDRQGPLGVNAKRDRTGDKTYQICSTSLLIDGAFIPSADGFNVVANSSGDVFDFGANSGVTWGPIWARRFVPNLRTCAGSVNDYWGTETLAGILDLIEQSRHGVIGMHANVGLTFDLRAVRMIEGRSLMSFNTVLVNLDNSKQRDPEYAKKNRPSVDFRVLVDGKLRFERLDIGRDDGEIVVGVPLTKADRFMTLASTDAGNSKWFDHLILVDAALLLDER